MNRPMVLPFGLIVLTLFTGQPAPAQVIGSKHNLSASGSGEVKAFGEQEVCVFCHAPHNTAPSTPLWNRILPALVYEPYASSTMVSEPGQPTSASKLCLSCHDGTIGLGTVLNRDNPIAMSGTLSERAQLTTDLSDDHPVSFYYDSVLAAENSELVDPALLGDGVGLDSDGQMQCTSCHDPHADTYGKFLVMDNAFSALCVACHDKDGWEGSAHRSSTATWDGSGFDPWPNSQRTSVAANGCENCHATHAAGSPERLLNFPVEEDNCLSCHSGSVAQQNIAAELQKFYRHPVGSFAGAHDPTEDFDTMPRHVECVDCHDPHSANDVEASAPNVGGPLTGVAGVTAGGTRIDNADYEYEVCFRCHSDNVGVPPPLVERQILQPNLRLKFDTANPSFHPVESPGANSSVPSLIFPMTTASIISCGDCHSNDAGPGGGGLGPAGPHGSVWPFLLEREYRTADNTAESYQAYALCYKCHDRQSVLANQSFKEHNKHVVKEDAPCSICHDPHGVNAAQGSATNNSHLINFDVSIVQPDPDTGMLEFQDLGANHGRCFLLCHGEKHSPEQY
ncbi:MAG: cytochrome c3 family protein [Candidatus Binatia bacterium]